MKRFTFLLLTGTLAGAGPGPVAGAQKAGVTESRMELDVTERNQLQQAQSTQRQPDNKK